MTSFLAFDTIIVYFLSITELLQIGRITKHPVFNIGRYLNYICVKVT